ncbi:hypothetical protein UFOVP307_39 [uncultured Caudovirales phage]|uniref:Uncharacterized protein n=1 Tax=uncultured Caudovirales phage TaxID=2100421 RepID=A0A6J5LYB1_9CAUD|nr:hypothetical protein UFOVP307_39 [uncultured Caudovirales phage]
MNFEWPTNDSSRIGTLQKLRSPRVDTQVQPKEIDDWLKQSIALVAGCVRGLGTNQRKVRYFAFEGQNEQVKE